MGRDKAVLRVGGRRLVDRAAEALVSLFPEVLVATGGRPLRLPAGIRAVADRFPGRGPAAGVDAAFSATRRRFLFVMACDMPAPSPALVRLLWGLARRGRGAVAEGPSGVEPLFGFYPRDTAGWLARELGAGRDVPARRLASRARRVPWEAARRADPEGASFLNLNRPADVARFNKGGNDAKVPGRSGKPGPNRQREVTVGSLIKKRRKKMNKHKYRKMRKRLAFLRK